MGPKGDRGEKGNDGVNGSRGTTGDKGNTGSPGVKGDVSVQLMYIKSYPYLIIHTYIHYAHITSVYFVV